MSEHTKGPFDVEFRKPDGRTIHDAVIRNANRDPIALIPMAGWDIKTGKEIASLLKAAPDLLRELERLVARKLPSDCLDARAAIAKARGENV